jgi:hypothetical protein
MTATPISMSSGPVFGSVARSLAIPPKSWLVTQNTSASPVPSAAAGNRVMRTSAPTPTRYSAATLSGRVDDLRREAARPHEALRLERAVDEPEHAERDLELAAGDRHATAASRRTGRL